MSAHVSHDESVLLHSRVPQISFPLNSADSLDHRILHFRPHQLACLSGLTEFRPIWVLQRLDQKADDRFYLSASIENFALVWSAVWKVLQEKEGSAFKQYNVGGGSIVPWKYMVDLHRYGGIQRRARIGIESKRAKNFFLRETSGGQSIYILQVGLVSFRRRQLC